jgi:hypothetical protein
VSYYNFVTYGGTVMPDFTAILILEYFLATPVKSAALSLT